MKQAQHEDRTTVQSAWLPYGEPDRAATTRLFCFHHAGGNATAFREWAASLPPQIQVCPVEIPGHGTRMREAPSCSMTEVIQDLEEALAPWLSVPFSFFGHSMGASIALELTYRLQARHGVLPQCLFVSGRRAPGRAELPPIHELSEPQFIEEIRRLSGTPEEILAHPEILAVLLPLLRADFALIESCPRLSRVPLACPIVAFGGLQDHRVSWDDVFAWRKITSARFAMEMFPGDHFYLNSSRAALLRSLANHLVDGSLCEQRPRNMAAC